MKNPIFIMLTMIFCHILDDFCLQQGCLSKLKQKKFWEENAPQELYKNDYKIALIVHSFSWSFMIMLPIFFLVNFNVDILMVGIFLVNQIIHYRIDNLKANKLKINLEVDQGIHLIQIMVTWLFYYFYL